MEKLIYDEPNVKIYYLDDIFVGKVIWDGKITSDGYRNAITFLLNFGEKGKKVENYMSDITNQSVVSPEDRKWFEDHAIPRGMKLGLKRGGVVFDGSVFKKYYLNILLKATNKFGIDLKFFSTQQDALDWFRSFYK